MPPVYQNLSGAEPAAAQPPQPDTPSEYPSQNTSDASPHDQIAATTTSTLRQSPHPTAPSDPDAGPGADTDADVDADDIDVDTDAEAELDWTDARELEIARLEAENAQLRAILGIDAASLASAGLPDVEPDPPMLFAIPAPGSSAWATGGAEPMNPFTYGFREDPSVLGLAATPSRLHTLTPPTAPNVGGGRPGAGVFVSAAWGPMGGGGGGNGGGGLPMSQGVMSQMQGPLGSMHPKAPAPSLGVAGLARTMDLQGPGIGGGPGGVGRGRGILFGGRGRSVGW